MPANGYTEIEEIKVGAFVSFTYEDLSTGDGPQFIRGKIIEIGEVGNPECPLNHVRVEYGFKNENDPDSKRIKWRYKNVHKSDLH